MRINLEENQDSGTPAIDVSGLPCPQCGEQHGGVHIVAVRIAPYGNGLGLSA